MKIEIFKLLVYFFNIYFSSKFKYNVLIAMINNYTVCHAEVNAVMNKNCADVTGCSIYVALFPCNECSKILIQAGIKDIIYYSDKHKDKNETIASKKMLNFAGVKYRLVSIFILENCLNFSLFISTII